MSFIRLVYILDESVAPAILHKHARLHILRDDDGSRLRGPGGDKFGHLFGRERAKDGSF